MKLLPPPLLLPSCPLPGSPAAPAACCTRIGGFKLAASASFTFLVKNI
jgi:hypothetical protein